MKLNIIHPANALNKAYRKEKVSRHEIELFKENLRTLLTRINIDEGEEHNKNLLADFLKDTWYKDRYEMNTKGRTDLVIHNGKSSGDSVGVIIETKSPKNKTEMISETKPNVKAMHELIFYYLNERITEQNNQVKRLIITNAVEWFIFDEAWFDKHIFRNAKLKKEYESHKLSGKPTQSFYDGIAKPLLDDIEDDIDCTYFNFEQYRKIAANTNKDDDNKLIALYKVLSPVHLLIQPFANDSNSLDTKFYTELLHIIGLEEVKEGSKKLIRQKSKPDGASLLENTITKLEDKDCLRNVSGLSNYGTTQKDRLFNIALELCITWVNRILFVKLLEGQMVTYHKGNKDQLFLNINAIADFDDLNDLFFLVLAERPDVRRDHLKEKFARVPYLNSSLFERTQLERETLEISELNNKLELPVHTATVLKDAKGKKLSGKLVTLQYLFHFLDAYDFSSDGGEEIQEENKNLINASVLGLIFEKINGYKDGSFFTPGFITMYMCRETIRRAVLQKFKEAKGWECSNLDELHNKIEDKKEANALINSLTICDPAVGSGHFLVSALNEMIAIKSELKILQDKHGKVLRDYDLSVVNDELVIIDKDGKLFDYNPHNKESRRVQETLFHEKETIIENCLFGVDINPNSVKICRLRLWIELLKNAYYTEESGYTQLETLPNIDINIKCGNSLISRFALDADLSKALKQSKWNIDSYKIAVQSYRNAETKEQKRDLEKLIEDIKGNFRTEINNNDPKIKKLQKLNTEYYHKYQAGQLFDAKLTAAQKKEKAAYEKDINKLDTEIKEIKNNKIYENAFEWRFEFPEVLDDNGKYVGFDITVGNPPYIQLQKLPDDVKQAFESQDYKTFTKTGDIYQLFYEQGNNILRSEGFLCYITSNKWMRTDYGSVTRKYLGSECKSILLIDFGMAQMFDTATTYTNILLASKTQADSTIRMCRIKDDYKVNILLEDYVDFAAIDIANPLEKSWICYAKDEYNLITKIVSRGRPIKKWDIQINYGIKTGFNEAFIISDEVKNKLINEDPKSAEIIIPILRGEDIKAYVPDWAGKWLINTHNGIKSKGISRVDVETNYPAVYNWLMNFEDTLKKRSDKGDHWTNLRNCAYLDEFYKPKIIYPNMTKYMPFVYDKHQFFTNQKCFIMTGRYLGYLTAFLNSKIFRFAFKEYFPELLGDTRELSKVFFENVTVKEVSDEMNVIFEDIVDKISDCKRNGESTIHLEESVERMLSDIYELNDDELAIVGINNSLSIESEEAKMERSSLVKS